LFGEVMVDGMESHRRAVERIFQDESLTSELTDEAADILLRWGVDRAEEALEGARRSPSTDPRASITRLRKVMRCLNRLAGAVAPDRQVARLESLLSELDSRSESARDS
jgi:hypothetical protein